MVYVSPRPQLRVTHTPPTHGTLAPESRGRPMQLDLPSARTQAHPSVPQPSRTSQQRI